MKYAKVVVGLPVEGPFDYSVPEDLIPQIKVGMRVEVGFRNSHLTGYVVSLSAKSKIKNIKPIIKLIDSVPVLSEVALKLTKKVSEYYCCSWGEAIEVALPQGVREGRI